MRWVYHEVGLTASIICLLDRPHLFITLRKTITEGNTGNDQVQTTKALYCGSILVIDTTRYNEEPIGLNHDTVLHTPEGPSP